MGKEAELCNAFSEAQDLVSCSLIAVHTLDAASARAHLTMDTCSEATLQDDPLVKWTSSDEARLPSAAALQTSVSAELDLLERIHLLLNDRSLLERGDKSTIKIILRRLSRLLPLLLDVRDAWPAVFKFVSYDEEVSFQRSLTGSAPNQICLDHHPNSVACICRHLADVIISSEPLHCGLAAESGP
jgi:hypothetical protein